MTADAWAAPGAAARFLAVSSRRHQNLIKSRTWSMPQSPKVVSLIAPHVSGRRAPIVDAADDVGNVPPNP